MLDLYAGVGTIGLSVARDEHLTLIECDKSAYAELIRNCQGIINEDPTRLTRSVKSEAPPITMGRSERVPKSNI